MLLNLFSGYFIFYVSQSKSKQKTLELRCCFVAVVQNENWILSTNEWWLESIRIVHIFRISVIAKENNQYLFILCFCLEFSRKEETTVWWTIEKWFKCGISIILFFLKKTNTILKIFTFHKKNVSISSVPAQILNDFMNSTKYINLIVTTGYFLSKCSR